MSVWGINILHHEQALICCFTWHCFRGYKEHLVNTQRVAAIHHAAGARMADGLLHMQVRIGRNGASQAIALPA